MDVRILEKEVHEFAIEFGLEGKTFVFYKSKFSIKMDFVKYGTKLV